MRERFDDLARIVARDGRIKRGPLKNSFDTCLRDVLYIIMDIPSNSGVPNAQDQMEDGEVRKTAQC